MHGKSFIIDFRKVHGDKYDYSKAIFKNTNTKIEIGCPIHKEFWQRPSDHKRPNGCPDCKINRIKTTAEHIKDFNKIHNSKYNYSKINYINSIIKIEIGCPIHKEFWQTPGNHKNGQGCPKCNESKGESKIRLWLEENNISFKQEYKFIKGNSSRFDFFIDYLNLCIEFDGRYHYDLIPGRENELIKTQKRDKLKNQYCKDNNIKLVRIPYWNFNSIENILIKEIK